MRYRARHSRGFTLVELLMTIALVAILAGVAAPTISTFANRAKMRGLSTDFSLSLQRTRVEAINRNMCATMCMSTTAGSSSPSCASASSNWGTGWIVFLNPTCDSTISSPAAADIVSVQNGFTSRITLQNHSGNAALGSVMFTSRGVPTTGGSSGFNLVDSTVSASDSINRTICLDSLGRVRTIGYSASATCS